MLALEVGSAYVQRFLWSIPNSVAAAFPNAFFGRGASSLFLALLLNLCEPVHVCGDHHLDTEIWSRLIRLLRASSVTPRQFSLFVSRDLMSLSPATA